MDGLEEFQAQIAVGESPFSTPGLAASLRESLAALRRELRTYSEGLAALRSEVRALRRTAPEYVRAERLANTCAERAERDATEASPKTSVFRNDVRHDAALGE